MSSPHVACYLLDQAHIAEFAPDGCARLLGGFAALDLVTHCHVEMALDFGFEFVFFASPPGK
jgi:hypothetical protein